VKSEVMTVTSKKHWRHKNSDGDGSDAEDDVHIQSAREVKKEKFEVKSEVNQR
jgi:hypothetical protein